MSFAFQRPGRALWSVMIAMGALGVFSAFLATWVPSGYRLFTWLDCELAHAFTQPWRLFTSGLLTSPEHWNHLVFSLVGLYFLGAPLEKRWGAWRFVRFLLIAVLLGNLTTLAVDAITPVDAQARFHPGIVYGPSAALTAIVVAWTRDFGNSTINLMFVLPVRAKVLFWVTIGLCVLALIYPEGLPEGVVAPFGGVVAGLLFGGSPSLARSAWLRLRLAVLRRRASTMQVDDILSARPKRRPRPGTPPLRVVPGGLDDVLKKRTPPKDKRYLN